MPYREFLYLDEKLVNELLAQVEDGIYDEDERASASSTERSRGLEASMEVSPARVGGSNARRRQGMTSPDAYLDRRRKAAIIDFTRH
jgi:hypothetical protein